MIPQIVWFITASGEDPWVTPSYPFLSNMSMKWLKCLRWRPFSFQKSKGTCNNFDVFSFFSAVIIFNLTQLATMILLKTRHCKPVYHLPNLRISNYSFYQNAKFIKPPIWVCWNPLPSSVLHRLSQTYCTTDQSCLIRMHLSDNTFCPRSVGKKVNR